MWWNDVGKAAVEKKKDVWNDVLGAWAEVVKERCMEAYKKKTERLKDVYTRAKRG